MARKIKFKIQTMGLIKRIDGGLVLKNAKIFLFKKA
jgi:hypothetical protein